MLHRHQTHSTVELDRIAEYEQTLPMAGSSSPPPRASERGASWNDSDSEESNDGERAEAGIKVKRY